MQSLDNELQDKPQIPQEEVPMKQHFKNRSLMTVLIVGVVILIALALIVFRHSGANISDLSKKITDSTSELPFKEMTVPYLRSRTYQSSLGEQKQIATNDSYTSYLTSYTSDGFKINALLTKPEGEEPKGGWPAIVFVHGYIPPTLYVTTEKYVAYVDYLARQGFVVLKIDLRGHGESEGSPGGGYYGSDYVVDTLNAYAALQSTDFVNKNKIGLWGHSMAGNIVLRSFVVKPEIPAVVIWAGAVYSYEDQRKYGIHDNSYRPPEVTVAQQQNSRQSLFSKVGSPSATSPFWKQVAPTNYLNDIKGAIEIHHAIDDDVVNIGYSRDLMALLDKTSVIHKLYEYPTGGHNIEGASFNVAIERTADFYKKYLTNAE